jgi:phosphatidylinositol alpha-1,6-mannosyltransferase
MLSETKHLTPVASAEILHSAQDNKSVVGGLGGKCTSFLPTLVISENFLPGCGGTITWLYETYRRFAPGEIVVVAGDKGNTADIDRALPFKVERIRMLMNDWDPTRPASLWQYLLMFRYVRKSRQRHQAAQIHCMKVLPEGAVAWALWHIAGVPYLLYAHGEEIQMRLTSRKLARLIPILYRDATAIIANSYHTKQLLVDIGVRSERIHVIHPGVDASAFHADGTASLAIRQRHNLSNAFVLLTVGRLQRRKGQDMVIKALPLIRRRCPTVKYLIVGAGQELKALQQLAREKEVSDAVVFVGEVADDERAAYYAACDVFLMPNRQVGADIEGFGMVFLEAGAAGKPVIGGRSGGTGEAIQQGVTGMLVDGESTEAIAAAVVDLLRNPGKSRAMGECGRQRVETAFSWDRIVELTQEVTANVARGVS